MGRLYPRGMTSANRALALVFLCFVIESFGEDAPSANVMELTMENFVEIVTDSKKHVLVMFFAPWCGHCKEFAPVYDKIAKEYEGNDSFVVAKLDAEAHAVFAKMYKVTSYPTIKIFPKKEKKGIETQNKHGVKELRHGWA